MSSTTSATTAHEFVKGSATAPDLCHFVIFDAGAGGRFAGYCGQPKDAAIHRASHKFVWGASGGGCDLTVNGHACGLPRHHSIHRAEPPAESPSVQCDRCKNWVPQDTVKAQAGVTFCAHCQDKFLGWVATEASTQDAASGTAEAYHAHLKQCRKCRTGLCDEGRRLWEANGRQPATIAIADIGSEAEGAALTEANLSQVDLRLLDLVRHSRDLLHEADLITDEEYAVLTLNGVDSVQRLESYDALRAELSRLRELAYVPQFIAGDEELTYQDYSERLLRRKLELEADVDRAITVLDLSSPYDSIEDACRQRMQAHIAASDNLIEADKQIDRLNKALRHMLYIFDRELPEGSIGADACAAARDAMGETK